MLPQKQRRVRPGRHGCRNKSGMTEGGPTGPAFAGVTALATPYSPSAIFASSRVVAGGWAETRAAVQA